MKQNSYSKYLKHPIASNKFLSVLCFPLYLLVLIIPKNKGIKLFGSMNGYAIVDNSKYMYVNEYRKGFYFITKNKELLKVPIFDNNYPVYCFSLKGLILQIIAYEVYYTHSIFDFFSPLVMGAKVFALWHGVPGKKINTALDEQKKYLNTIPFFIYNYIFPYKYYAYCKYVFCPSEELINIYKECFQIGRPKIIIHKQPRNLYAAQNIKENNIILYAPTYRRNRSIVEIMEYLGFFKDDFLSFIKENKVTIVIRPHPIDLDDLLKKELPNTFSIDRSKDIYETITKYSLIITDYSSLFYDALELNIPVKILQNDFDLYKKENGLFSSFEEYINDNSEHCITDIIMTLVKDKTNE